MWRARPAIMAVSMVALAFGFLCGCLTVLSIWQDRIVLLEHFGRPGWDWHLDFSEGNIRFIVKDYDVFVILDGEFGQNMSVSPKEILGLLERGKTVIGASSMGALRASELDRSGMIGVGWVYDYFRRCAIRRDADVALVYSPFDFKPMTVPIVDLEYWMELACAAGLIGNRERSLLL